MHWIFFDPLPWDYDVAAPLTQPMGGSQSAMCYLATALARRGHQVMTVTGVASSREVNGVRCQSRRETPLEQFAAPGTITVVLNGPAELAVGLRRSLAQRPRLILWTQHAPNQPGVRGLADPAHRAAWDRIVCVSDWHRAVVHELLAVPREQSEVLRNAIAPSFEHLVADAGSIARAKSGALRLAYTSTPFRGLDVLVHCFPELRRRHPACRLDIYSSMQVYGDTPEQDKYQRLYEQCRATEGIDYHGSLPQPELAIALAGVSVLAYPNTFAETSCIAAMEALAAGAYVVTSDQGALPETCSGWGTLVRPMSPAHSREQFELEFTNAVDHVLNELQADAAAFWWKRWQQAQAIASTHTWDLRAAEWEAAGVRWMSPHG